MCSWFIALVLYDSWFGWISLIPIAIFNHIRLKKKQQENAVIRFKKEYQEMLSSLSSSLRAGHSIENSFKEVEDNLRLLYVDSSVIAEEIHYLNQNIAMHIPVEEAFYRFACLHPLEEVSSLSEILRFSKRTGGNYIGNISQTAEKIHQSLELSQEIDAMTAEKQIELKIMAVMPLVLLGYIKFSSPEFLVSMYHNPGGVLIMSACIIGYLISLTIGEKIIHISI